MRLLKQSTAYSLMVFMTDSSDHVTGKTGLTLTITASKAGAAFASIAPTVTERSSGWYSVALTATHSDTIGDLTLHITATGADPTDLVMQVRANTTDELLASADYTAPLDAAGVRGAVGLASANLDTQLAPVANLPSDPADESLVIAATDAIMSRLGAPAGASVSVDIAAVKTVADAVQAKTDNLPASPAATSDVPTAAAIADAVLDEATAGHTTAGSFSKAVIDILTAVTAVQASTDNLPADPADESLIIAATDAIATLVTAIKAKTDQLAFTVANQVDANLQSINDTALTGDGSADTPWNPA